MSGSLGRTKRFGGYFRRNDEYPNPATTVAYHLLPHDSRGHPPYTNATTQAPGSLSLTPDS